MSKLISLGRVSTEEQVSNTSLKDQQYKMEMYAAAKGDVIVESYEDAGFTGTTLWRPALWKAIQRLKCLECEPRPMPLINEQNDAWWLMKCNCGKMKGADGLIVYSMDRLSRMSKHLIFLTGEVLAGKGLVVVSGLGECDTRTPQGRLVTGIFSLLAQMDREVFLDKMKDSKAALKREGASLGGRPPYGFNTAYGKNALVVNVIEEQVILTVLTDMYLGLSLKQIANKLENEGVHNRSGKPFAKTQLMRMCHGPNLMYMSLVRETYARWHRTAMIQAREIMDEQKVKDAERILEVRKLRYMPTKVDTAGGVA